MSPDSYKPKVLIVDDRQENLIAMERILSPLNAELLFASSGNEALALTLEHQFALILLDVMMPEMDGFETATLLRQNKATKDIPIIFVTAIGKDDRLVFRGYEVGAVDYLFKPLNPDILQSKVNVFLDLHCQKVTLNRANYELRNANEKILVQQKNIVEEERLNALLQMAGATAHELSQPLTALLFGINMLEMSSENTDRISRHLGDIKKAGQRISEIVKRIKTLNRYELTAHDRDHDIIKLDQKLKILHIEEDDIFAATLSELLGEESNIVINRTRDIREGLDKFRQGHFDVIFLAQNLSNGSVRDFLSHIGNLVQEIPVVVMADEDDPVMASQMLRAGVYDCLPKQKVNSQSLRRLLINTLERFHLHKEVQQTKAKMAEMLNIDTLTGICSRQHFLQVLEEEFERAKRYGAELSLLIMDLDSFKNINVIYGHSAGDHVLSRIGQILQQNKRCNDQTCRYGGEEFAILLPNIDINNAMIVGEKFRQLVSSQSFADEGQPFKVTVSIGLASVHGAATTDELLDNAKQALHQAKQEGRNRVTAFA